MNLPAFAFPFIGFPQPAQNPTLYNGQNLDFLSVLFKGYFNIIVREILAQLFEQILHRLIQRCGFRKAAVLKRGFDIIVNKDQRKPEFLDIQPQSHNRSDYIVVSEIIRLGKGHLNLPRTIAIFELRRADSIRLFITSAGNIDILAQLTAHRVEIPMHNLIVFIHQ